jgi:predicted GNAT family acetyltransferase
MALTDKTGAPVSVRKESDKFVITVEGQDVGLAAFEDEGEQRVFFHTEVDEAFGGRGLSSVLIGEALAQTKAAGLRIVPVCPAVAAFCKKHPEFADVVDRPTPQIMDRLQR